jgi:hypothetical protein
MGVVSEKTKSKSQEVSNAITADSCDLSPVSAFLTQHKKITSDNADVVVSSSDIAPNTPVTSSAAISAAIAAQAAVATASSHPAMAIMTAGSVAMTTPVHNKSSLSAAVIVPQTTAATGGDSDDSPAALLMDPKLSPFSNLKKLREQTTAGKNISTTTASTSHTTEEADELKEVSLANAQPIISTFQQQLLSAAVAKSSSTNVTMTPRPSAVAEENRTSNSASVITSSLRLPSDGNDSDNDENIPPPSHLNHARPANLKHILINNNNNNNNNNTNKGSQSLVKPSIAAVTAITGPAAGSVLKTPSKTNSALVVGSMVHTNTPYPHAHTPILNVNAKLNMSTQKKMSRKSNNKFTSNSNSKNNSILGFNDDGDDEEDENSYNSNNVKQLSKEFIDMKNISEQQIVGKLLQDTQVTSTATTATAAVMTPLTKNSVQVLEPLNENHSNPEEDEDDFIPPRSNTASPMPATNYSPLPFSNTNITNNNKRQSFMSRLSLGGNGTGNGNTSSSTRRISSSFFKPNPQQLKQNFLKFIQSGEASLAREILSTSNNSIELDAIEASELLLKCVNRIENLKEEQETLILLIDECHADVNTRDSEGQTALMTLFTDPLLGMIN